MIKPRRFCAVVLSASAAFSLAADEFPALVPDVEIHGLNVRPEQNYAAAQSNLGLCYAYGPGVAEDWVEAYKWLSLAARQGHEGAKNYMTVLESKLLTPEQIAQGQKRAREFKPR
jgi:TPR repeat protein